MVLFLSVRNIIKNIKDNIIIILLITVISFLFFIGNSIIGKADRNIRSSYIESLTGDVVLQKKSDITMNLFGANTPVIDSYFSIPVIPAYDSIMKIISADSQITGITSQVSGRAFLDIFDYREPVLLCGIDTESYFSLFPGIMLEKGRFLETGEYGAMITSERARKIERESGHSLYIGAPLLFTSGSTMGFKIREVPLIGIYHYKNPGPFMDEIVIIDPHTVRILNSIQVANNVAIEDQSTNLLRSDSDDIFGDLFSSYEEIEDEINDEGFSVELLQNYLREVKQDNSVPSVGGDWNFIILRLNNRSSAAFTSRLNEKLELYGISAVDWRIASGSSAILPLLTQFLFNSGLFLVSAAGIIVITNILLISVFLRVREIGTLRTIGASDSFIRSLIYCENFIVSIIAGFTGVIVGIFVLNWINSLDITISNDLITSILGDSAILHLEFMPLIAVFSLLLSVLLGFFASIYPVESAVRIRPILAVRQG